MRIVIIGGTGHVGSFFVPRLVRVGHQVIVVSRNVSTPYLSDPAWDEVKQIAIDRTDPAYKEGFGARIAKMKPDIVIDMICFDKATAEQMVQALEGVVSHYLFCGTIWVYGHSVVVPADEERPRKPLTDYGIGKAEAESFLLKKAKENDFPTTILHPGHIVGPGWRPVNPAGHLNVDVFRKLKNGEEILLPNLGMETLHHVHADDIAQAFELAIDHGEVCKGESFNIVSPQAMTMLGYAELMGEWFGKPARIKFLPWAEWEKTVAEEDAVITWDHLIHSPSYSIEKAKRLLQYKPKYSSIEAVQESVDWLINHKKIS